MDNQMLDDARRLDRSRSGSVSSSHRWRSSYSSVGAPLISSNLNIERSIAAQTKREEEERKENRRRHEAELKRQDAALAQRKKEFAAQQAREEKERKAQREAQQKRELAERKMERERRKRLDQMQAAEQIMPEEAETKKHYTETLEVGSQGRVVLNALRQEAEVFEQAQAAAQPPVLTREQKGDYQGELLDKIKTAIESQRRSKLQELQHCLGPDFYSIRKHFAEQSKKMYWSWLRMMMELSLLFIKEQALIDFVHQNKVTNLVAGLSLQRQSSDQEPDNFVRRVKDHLLEVFSEDRTFNLPIAWILYQDFHDLLQEHGRKLLAKEREEIERIEAINLAKMFRTLSKRCEHLKNKIRECQAKQKGFNAKLERIMSNNSARDNQWTDFLSSLQTSSLSREDKSKHIELIVKSNIAYAPLESYGSIVEGAEYISLVDFAIEEAQKNNGAQEQQMLPLIELLLKRGSELSKIPQGQLTLDTLELLLKYTDSRTDFRQMIKFALEECVRTIKEHWRISRYLIDHCYGGQANIGSLQLLTLELSAKRVMISVRKEDQLAWNAVRRAQTELAATWKKGYGVFGSTLFAIENKKETGAVIVGVLKEPNEESEAGSARERSTSGGDSMSGSSGPSFQLVQF